MNLARDILEIVVVGGLAALSGAVVACLCIAYDRHKLRRDK
jgi:branched-subunit amino acid ABC-type transport system permease component